jgi:hypothetical protein
VLAPTPPIPKFLPFGIYEALPVVAKRAAGMEPITNDSKMALSSLPILVPCANYNEYELNIIICIKLKNSHHTFVIHTLLCCNVEISFAIEIKEIHFTR